MESQRHPTPEAIFSKPGRLSGWWRANHHLDGLVLEPKTRGSSCLWKWRILFQSFPLLDFNDRFQHLEGPFSPKEGAKRCFRNCGRKTFQDCDSNKKRPGVGKAINFQKSEPCFLKLEVNGFLHVYFVQEEATLWLLGDSHKPCHDWTTTNSESAMADKTLGLFCVTFTSRFFFGRCEVKSWGTSLLFPHSFRDFGGISSIWSPWWGNYTRWFLKSWKNPECLLCSKWRTNPISSLHNERAKAATALLKGLTLMGTPFRLGALACWMRQV